MEIIATILVVCSGLTHAVWNLFTKNSLNKTAFLWSITIVSCVLLFPYFVVEVSDVPLRGWLFILLSMGFQAAYGLLLVKAYTFGDMSRVYPIMRGTGAMLVPIVSVLIFSESMTAIGWLGLACIVCGLFSISIFDLIRSRQFDKMTLHAITLAFMVGLCITGYTLTDKKILEYISPIALIEVSNIGYILALSYFTFKSKALKREWQANWKTILVGAIFSPGSYVLFLFAMNLSPLSHIAPIREIGTVFGTILGITVLKEQQGMRRIVLSAVIACGIMTIGLWGK